MTLVDPADPPERRAAKLLRIAEALMNRVEQSPDHSSLAYAQFERAARLEGEVRQRTEQLERTLDLLHDSNARLAAAMEEAQAARENLAQAIETVDEGFALFDADDRLVLHNSRFCIDLKDVAPNLRPGLPFADYVELVSRSEMLELPESQTPGEWRTRRLRRHSDSRTTFNVRLTMDRWIQVSEHRTGTGGTVILQTDVTKVVRAERRERDRMIDRQARMARATLDHLDQGVATFDRNARLVGWNAQMEAILAKPIGEDVLSLPFTDLMNRLASGFVFTGAIDRPALEAWAARRGRRRSLSFEVRQITGPAPRIHAVSAQQIPDGGFVISFTDVTSERESERALRDLNETLERRVDLRTNELGVALEEARRANASKTRFMAAASHDLLQPLSAAKLFVSAIEDRARDSDLGDVAGKAISALASVETIIEALLDISKLDSGRVNVTVKSTPLTAIFESLALEMTPLAAARGIDLRFVPCTLRVKSDPVLLRRMVQNLVANAIRHTDGKRVLVGVRRRDGTARIDVCDMGPGIAPADQADIFKEFHQLGPHRSGANGLGLGLAIVERAAATLKHGLGLASEPGRGSRFSVTVPVDTAPGDAPDRGGPEDARERPSLYGQVVMLVENDLEVARGITLMVEGWGADLIHAENAEGALSLLDDLGITPDALLIDHQLGEGPDGLELLELLRRAHGDLPARVISADRSDDLRRACDGAGAPLIPKPLDPDLVVGFLGAVAAGP
ncbi:hybrid sensor histidine kinase/response regulator [Jannaschia aquimarina]|uniref:histidine kinase n=1 Tax=Jannaschia aquimarina TaxID=935700 RepID=A0A0D1EFV0_9RHOB|nr:PAS-domain containing protein [Jannaschia aquimarina]KIT14740.1 Sensor protein TorS [Jannaschia aquimarina]SNS76532.1 signal transduction histidine kinase [Jannaschia aquimarina]